MGNIFINRNELLHKMNEYGSSNMDNPNYGVILDVLDAVTDMANEEVSEYDLDKVVGEIKANGHTMTEAKGKSKNEYKYYKAISVKKAEEIIRHGHLGGR